MAAVTCKGCGASSASELRRRGPHFGYYCAECGEQDGLWISKQNVIAQGYDPEALPEHVTEWDEPKPPCSVTGCDRPGIHEHHWMPRSLGKDCDKWPTGHLCTPHHWEWHRRVTPRIYLEMKRRSQEKKPPPRQPELVLVK